VQKATIKVVDKNHLSTQFLLSNWECADEWYNLKSISSNIIVLATGDESSYKGGKNGLDHPIAWYHNFESGRAFYTAIGHTYEAFSEPLFLIHLLAGIRYALGN